MKAVLIIDMPDDVLLDEWYAVKVVVDRLKATEEELMQGIPYDESKVFKFMPLRPLPNRWIPQVNGLSIEQQIRNIDFASGWNTCLEKITGETE